MFIAYFYITKTQMSDQSCTLLLTKILILVFSYLHKKWSYPELDRLKTEYQQPYIGGIHPKPYLACGTTFQWCHQGASLHVSLVTSHPINTLRETQIVGPFEPLNIQIKQVYYIFISLWLTSEHMTSVPSNLGSVSTFTALTLLTHFAWQSIWNLTWSGSI